MSDNTIRVGKRVLCGFCAIEMTVESVKVYVGGIGFLLACGHRNGYCVTCAIPVLDVSELPDVIKPVCPFCTTASVTGGRSAFLPAAESRLS